MYEPQNMSTKIFHAVYFIRPGSNHSTPQSDRISQRRLAYTAIWVITGTSFFSLWEDLEKRRRTENRGSDRGIEEAGCEGEK